MITDKVLNRHNSNDLKDVGFDTETPISKKDLKGTAHLEIEDYQTEQQQMENGYNSKSGGAGNMSVRVGSVQSGDEQTVIRASPSGLMSLSKYGKSRTNNMSYT